MVMAGQSKYTVVTDRSTWGCTNLKMNFSTNAIGHRIRNCFRFLAVVGKKGYICCQTKEKFCR